MIGTALLAGRAVVRFAQGRWQEAYEDFVECGRRNAEYSDRSRNYWWRADASMALADLGRHAQALELAEADLRSPASGVIRLRSRARFTPEVWPEARQG